MIPGVDNSGPHAGEECVCLMGVVFGVQSLTFFFFFHLQHTKKHLADTRNAALPCSCNADLGHKDTFYHFTRKSLFYNCQVVFGNTKLAVLCRYSIGSEIMWQCKATSLWDYKVQTGWPGRMTITATSKLVESYTKNECQWEKCSKRNWIAVLFVY